MENKGYIHVYTGNGKGKTTAAFGLAIRVLCAGGSVFIGQFVKNMKYNETKIELENPLKVVPLIHSNLTPVKFSHSPFCLFLFSSYSSCPLCRVLH